MLAKFKLLHALNPKSMELTFKIIFDKRHEKKNHTYGLKLRVYQDRNYKECSLGIDIPEIDWDSQLQMVLSSNANHKFFNTKLASVKSKIRKFILFNEDEEEIITATEIINQIKRKEQKKIISKPDILKYGREHILKLESTGNIGNSICYSCGINKLQAYAGKDKLLFEEVNYKFLENFNNSMLADGIKVNSISVYLRSIRALFTLQ